MESITLKTLILNHKVCTRISNVQESKEKHLFVTLIDQSVTPTKSTNVWFTKPTEEFLRSEGINNGDVLPVNVIMSFDLFKLQNKQMEDRFKLHSNLIRKEGSNTYTSLMDIFGGEEISSFNIQEFRDEFEAKPVPKEAPKEKPEPKGKSKASKA